MLAKKYRLPIQTVLGKSGATSKNSLFTVKIFPSPLPYCRFGIIISKKTSARATKRNYIRRQFFSAIEPFIKKEAGKDILIIVAPAAMRAGSIELRTNIAEALEKIL